MIDIKTYQDLIALGENEADRMEFVLQVIAEHQTSELYKIAADAELYYKHLNPTIMRAQKFVYDLAGRAHVDMWAANNKIPSRLYFYFITQAVQFLLGNGISFGDDGTKEKLGKDFDAVVQKAATNALNGGVAFGFWNNDHLEQFSVTEFAPLYDEENGALRAGVRYWQVDTSKPLRATLYEEDGYTEYIKHKSEEIKVLVDKRKYVQIVAKSEAGGEVIYDGENYPGFPIVPLFNVNRQSEIVGTRETLDAYDLMASALVNNVDDANLIYWIIRNAGGMDDIDDAKFIQRLKTMHVVHLEGDEQVDRHQVDVPFQASEVALSRLRSQLFDDFMALDVKEIANGATTATQIKAAYEPLNSKTDLFEYQVTEFVENILKLLGIDDEPTYTRSLIVNKQETIENLLTAAEYLSRDYITRKVMEVLGDIDLVDEIIDERDAEEVTRFSGGEDEGQTNTTNIEGGE